MSEELEREIREQRLPEAELIARARSAYGLSENGAIEHISFVRRQPVDDVVRLHSPTAGSSSSPS